MSTALDDAWLAYCTVCGCFWLVDTHDWGGPQTLCPDEPLAHRGAEMIYELMTARGPLLPEQPFRSAADCIPADAPGVYWPWGGSWDTPLSAVHVRTAAALTPPSSQAGRP